MTRSKGSKLKQLSNASNSTNFCKSKNDSMGVNDFLKTKSNSKKRKALRRNIRRRQIRYMKRMFKMRQREYINSQNNFLQMDNMRTPQKMPSPLSWNCSNIETIVIDDDDNDDNDSNNKMKVESTNNKSSMFCIDSNPCRLDHNISIPTYKYSSDCIILDSSSITNPTNNTQTPSTSSSTVNNNNDKDFQRSIIRNNNYEVTTVKDKRNELVTPSTSSSTIRVNNDKDFQRSIVQSTIRNNEVTTVKDKRNELVISNDSLLEEEDNADDDSVEFIGEEICLDSSSEPSSFIPLSKNPELFSRRSTNSEQFPSSSKEINILQAYNNNKTKCSISKGAQKTKKRMVIIDGNNVAYGHSRNQKFSVKGLEICIKYFMSAGHEVKAVVPQNRLQKTRSSDPALLEKLYKKGLIVLTPCKRLKGKMTSPYDDRFVLQLAAKLDGAVISNDNYADLLNESKEFREVIENRVIGYTWCGDIIMIPEDPYGRWGPSKDSILNRKCKSN